MPVELKTQPHLAYDVDDLAAAITRPLARLGRKIPEPAQWAENDEQRGGRDSRYREGERFPRS